MQLAKPEIKIGIVYTPALEPLLESGRGLIDIIEVEPQPWWMQDGKGGYNPEPAAFKRILSFSQPKIIHSVGLPVASSLGAEEAQWPALAKSIEVLKPLWISEHLAFMRFRNQGKIFHSGFLLPPLQSSGTIDIAVANIRDFKSRFALPFAFENVANYLRKMPAEMEDGAFYAETAGRADCHILLDLHNLWCNHLNGRQDFDEALDALPAGRVLEIHLAGGDEMDSLWLDAHSGLVPPPLLERLPEILCRFPNLQAIVFEIIPEYMEARSLTTEQIGVQLESIRKEIRKMKPEKKMEQATSKPPAIQYSEEKLPAPETWENILGHLVNKRKPKHTVTHMEDDPGITMLQKLVGQIRAGMIVELMKFSYRLMVLHLGEEKVLQLMHSFWQKSFPKAFVPDEVRQFSRYLKKQQLDVPNLAEVIRYELAFITSLETGKPEKVRFSSDPIPLLNALSEGKLPQSLTAGNYLLEVSAATE
jgi:uncharacterized protein (UPF0276 family)